MADLAWYKGHEFTDTLGNPLNGGLIRIYDATTTNARTVYKDAAQATPWTQPITLDSSGRLTDAIYFPTGAWKFVRTNSTGGDSITEDNIPGAVTIPSSVYAQPELPVLTKAVNYTIVVGDLGKKINVDATGGDVTITLMSAITAGDGAYLAIQNVGATGSVTVDTFGAQTINATTSIILRAQFDSADIVGDGANWSADISAERRTVLSKTASYTVTQADFGRLIKVNATSGAATLSLLSAVTAGSGFDLEIKKTDASANAVTLDPSGAQTIDGASTVALSDQWQSIHIRSDGANWLTISKTESSASVTVAGLIEIATEAENAARTSLTLAVVPGYDPFPPGYLFGCTLSNGTDAVNDIDISAGARRSVADTTNLILAAAITKRLDAAWAVGDANGGLDTGSIANDVYHIWLIKRIDTGVVDALFSASATSPTMPTNYTEKRRLGSVIRSGATILAFTQNEDEFLLKVPIRDVSTNNPGTSAVTPTLTVPDGIQVVALISLTLLSDGGEDRNVLITSPDQTNTAASSSLFDLSAGASAHLNSIAKAVRTSTSATVRYRLDASSATTTITVLTHGWRDTRGRLA